MSHHVAHEEHIIENAWDSPNSVKFWIVLAILNCFFSRIRKIEPSHYNMHAVY